MSERRSATAAQSVIDRSGTTQFTPVWKHDNPLPQAGKHCVTSRTTAVPTLPSRGPAQLGQRTVPWWRTGIRGSPRWPGPVKGTHVLGTKLGMNIRRSCRSVDTGDSGIGTVRTHRTKLAMESWVPDTLLVKGDVGVDTSTPQTGVNDWFQTIHLGQYCSLIPDIPTLHSPIRSTHLEPCFANSTILTQLQSDVQMASPIRSSPKPGTKLVPHRSVRFTNTAVTRFSGNTCWYQHQQVFDAIVKSRGWNNQTAALQLFAHYEGDEAGCRGVSRIITPLLGNWRSTGGSLRTLFDDIFATELETLAARGFGDAGPSARIRMVRDRFVKRFVY